MQRFGHPYSKLPWIWLVETVEYEMIFHFQNKEHSLWTHREGRSCSGVVLQPINDCWRPFHLLFFIWWLLKIISSFICFTLTGLWSWGDKPLHADCRCLRAEQLKDWPFHYFNFQCEEDLCKTIIPKRPDTGTKQNCHIVSLPWPKIIASSISLSMSSNTFNLKL